MDLVVHYSDLTHFFENLTKVKIPSEIKPPLKSQHKMLGKQRKFRRIGNFKQNNGRSSKKRYRLTKNKHPWVTQRMK